MAQVRAGVAGTNGIAGFSLKEFSERSEREKAPSQEQFGSSCERREQLRLTAIRQKATNSLQMVYR
eukprot:273134-Prorocentrum_minimum.AAC.3